jgi:hypothetical protein
MPGTHQVTVTAKTGPNVQNTAMVIPNVLAVNFDLNAPSLQIQTVVGAGDNVKEYDLTGVTTITCTITGGNYAFVIS